MLLLCNVSDVTSRPGRSRPVLGGLGRDTCGLGLGLGVGNDHDGHKIDHDGHKP